MGHCEIETEFDNALMREDGLDPIKFFTASHIKPSRERAEVIAPFYEGVTVDETLAAMKGMITVHHLLQAANPVKRWVVPDRDARRGQVCSSCTALWQTRSRTPNASRAARSSKSCIKRLCRWR